METKRRSLVKALSWRAFATVITASVTFLLTGEWLFALQVGVLDTASKLVLYYLHERAWVRINYGRVEPGDYQI
jgi:uncharacterized membrane protein